MNKREFRNTRT